MSPRPIVATIALIAIGSACQNIDQAMNAVKPLAQQVPVVGAYADTAAKGVHAGSLLAQSASTFTPEQEYYVGRAVSAQVLANPKFTQTSNQGLQDYVSNVGQAVALGSPSVKMPYQGYRFVVLESPTGDRCGSRRCRSRCGAGTRRARLASSRTRGGRRRPCCRPPSPGRGCSRW